MKLNLGCGDVLLGGYVNVDGRALPGVDLIHDLNKRFPFGDETIDEIIANDVLEHFPIAQTQSLLVDWVRMLRTGGRIAVRVPNMELLAHKLDCHLLPEANLMTMIYGGQDYAGNFHKAGFTKTTLYLALLEAGCSQIAETFETDNNINIVAVK